MTMSVLLLLIGTVFAGIGTVIGLLGDKQIEILFYLRAIIALIGAVLWESWKEKYK